MQLPLLRTEWIDPVTKAKGFFVIDKLVNDQCAGGIRMRQGLECKEIERLAQTMTLKLKTLGMSCGGSKAGIAYNASAADALDVLKRFLEAHRAFLLENWSTSEDLGTKAEDISRIVREMGISNTFIAAMAKMPQPEQTWVKSEKISSLIIDGLSIGDLATGYGVAVSTLKSMVLLGMDSNKTHIAIQGFGSVGASAALYLAKAGCLIVAIADAEGTIFNQSGLDIEQLIGLKNRLGIINRTLLSKDHILLPREVWLELEVDVLIPAAIADTITLENSSQIKAKLIVEGANIPTTKEAEKELTNRGVYIIPDFIANAGGVGVLGIILDPKVEPTKEGVFGYLNEKIGTTTMNSLQNALLNGKSVREGALEALLNN